MKVVIFCGGLGVRMGEETQRIPKPMVEIGGKPILWHIMRYYSMWGHKEFILALGYKAEIVKQYFLSYNGALFNDFMLGHSAGQSTLELLSRDLDEWQITFVDTGLTTNIGGRLRAIAPHLGEDEVFLATYGDGLTDAPLEHMIRTFEESGKTGCSCRFTAVQRPPGLCRRRRHRRRRRAGWRAPNSDERRFLHLQARSHGVDRARRGARRRAVLKADRARGVDRLSLRRLLPADGHDQGSQTLESLHDSGEAPWRRLPSEIEADAGSVSG